MAARIWLTSCGASSRKMEVTSRSSSRSPSTRWSAMLTSNGDASTAPTAAGAGAGAGGTGGDGGGGGGADAGGGVGAGLEPGEPGAGIGDPEDPAGGSDFMGVEAGRADVAWS